MVCPVPAVTSVCTSVGWQVQRADVNERKAKFKAYLTGLNGQFSA